jgi:cytochrome c553
VVVLVLGALGLDAEPAAAGNAARGKQLAYTCLGCHGSANYENAYPMYRVPKLWGQHQDYIVSALQGYRSGDRAHATMHAQASSMSDQDMLDIAAFLASPPAAPPAAPVGTPPATAQVCVACHGNDGVGIASMYPSLAGQYDDYIRRALNEYRKGGRKNAVMANFASQLKDADVAELAAYYSHQHAVVDTVPKRLSRYSAAN